MRNIVRRLYITSKPMFRNFSPFVFPVFFRNFSFLIGSVLLFPSGNFFKSSVSVGGDAITVSIVDLKQRSKVL